MHEYRLRVYYEDTDLAGIVYYANYLKFIERARSEYVRSLGVDQKAMKAERGIVFAVRRLEADYLSPARFDDQLLVQTAPVRMSGARLVLRQHVLRDDVAVFAAEVTLVALGETGAPVRFPAEFRALFA